MRRAAIFGVLGCLVACGSPAREPAARHEVTRPSAPIVAARCDAHHAAFRAAMATATGRCASDAECACFNPVVEEAGCGGISDAATAATLSAIEVAFHADACEWPHQCAAWACEPVCREGRCTNGGSGGRLLP